MSRFTYKQYTEYNGDKVLVILDNETGLIYHAVDDGNYTDKGKVYRCGYEDSAIEGKSYILFSYVDPSIEYVIFPNYMENTIEEVEEQIRNNRTGEILGI